MCKKCKGEGRFTTSPFPGIYTFEYCSCDHSMRMRQALEQKYQDFERRLEAACKQYGLI